MEIPLNVRFFDILNADHDVIVYKIKKKIKKKLSMGMESSMIYFSVSIVNFFFIFFFSYSKIMTVEWMDDGGGFPSVLQVAAATEHARGSSPCII